MWSQQYSWGNRRKRLEMVCDNVAAACFLRIWGPNRAFHLYVTLRCTYKAISLEAWESWTCIYSASIRKEQAAQDPNVGSIYDGVSRNYTESGPEKNSFDSYLGWQCGDCTWNARKVENEISGIEWDLIGNHNKKAEILKSKRAMRIETVVFLHSFGPQSLMSLGPGELFAAETSNALDYAKSPHSRQFRLVQLCLRKKKHVQDWREL